MALLNGLIWRRKGPSPRELAALVKTLADRCEPAVWQRIEGRTQAMSPAAARGYIRARAAAIVNEQVDLALVDRVSWPAEVREQILTETAQQTVRSVHHRLLNARHPAAQRRLAA